MAATINPDRPLTGRAGNGPMFSHTARPLQVATGTISLDTAYPNAGAQATRGYDISATVGATSPFKLFPNKVLVVEFDPIISPGTAPAAGTVVSGAYDPVNKRLRVLNNGTEVADGVSQANITGASALPYRAYGY